MGESQPCLPLDSLRSFKTYQHRAPPRRVMRCSGWGLGKSLVLHHHSPVHPGLRTLDLLIICNSITDQERRPRWAGERTWSDPLFRSVSSAGPQQYKYLWLQKGQQLQVLAYSICQGGYSRAQCQMLKGPPKNVLKTILGQ